VFGYINHELLLCKLKYYGILGKTLDWFKSNLFNRKQGVELNSLNTYSFYSYWEIVKHGVPQGLVPGHLFNIHINDFLSQINTLAEVIIFASDTSILVSHNHYDDLKIYLTLYCLTFPTGSRQITLN
jgi:hypothetical protein